jgi:hypothetical protein
VLQSLLLTALGGVLGAGGALLASHWQAREARRIRREQNARDDRYRLTADRIRAYSAFHVAAGSARAAMGIYTRSGGRDASLENVMDARNVLWDTFTLVALIGDDSTWGRASALIEFVTDVAQGRSGFVVAKWNELIQAFVQASRLELIPNPNLHSLSSFTEQPSTGEGP